MIARSLESAAVLGAPTNVGLPTLNAPDFAALFASVAVEQADSGAAPTAAPGLSTDAPAAFVFQTQADADAPVAMATFRPSRPPSETIDLPSVVTAPPIVGEASAKSSEPLPAGDPTPVLTVTALLVAEPVDQPVSGNAVEMIAWAVDKPVPNVPPVADGTPSSDPPTLDFAAVAIAAPVVGKPEKGAAGNFIDRLDMPLAAAFEIRAAPPVPMPDKFALPVIDRPVAFAPIVADAARDLITVSQDGDVRFKVRPEMLGAIAVTIERTDAGQTLRLGVETQAAVHAVRHAEPTMNDARGPAPFVQISVDMDTPDGRGRPARAASPDWNGQEHVGEEMQRQLPVSTGRYA